MLKSKVYLGLPDLSTNLALNGDFEVHTGDDIAEWIEVIPVDGSITSEDFGGNHWVNITGGADPDTPYFYLDVAVTPGAFHSFSFGSRGDDIDAIKFWIWDSTNSVSILTGVGSPWSAGFERTKVTYTVPDGCVSIRMAFEGIVNKSMYVDLAVLLEFEAITWRLNEDVLAVPSPSWGYGLGGKDPLRGVAETGMANFTLDNRESKYSPGHVDRVTGFEEGMAVKIVITSDDIMIDLDWDQIADMEEGSLSDFDSVTPAWDAEVEQQSNFDDQTDPDGDMNDYAETGHDVGNAIGFTFDDANPAWGRIDADAINQKSAVITLWFNKATLALANASQINMVHLHDGADTATWVPLLLFNNGGVYELGMQYVNDASGAISSSRVVIGAGWHKIDIHLAASTGVGNDDGYMRLYIDDDLVENFTGHDNDTRDWDVLKAGMFWTSSGTFGGTYYFDTIKLDSVGAPMADTLAAQNGIYGMSIPIMDNTPRYVTFTDPNNETRISVDFRIDPNLITMGSGEGFIVCLTNGTGGLSSYVYLYWSGSEYRLLFHYGEDGGATLFHSEVITDAPHRVRIVLVISSGTDNGYILAYVDDVLVDSVYGLDNDTFDIDEIRFGAVTSLDAGTYGIFYMDDCRWTNELEKIKFIGTMVDIPPSAGAFDDPVTSVVAHDWMGYLNKQELGLQALLSDKRVDEVLPTLLAEFPNQPEATDFDTGVEDFEVIFASDPSDSSMARMFAKLARNERGRIYSKGNGTLRFEKQGTRDGSQASAFTIDGTMSEFDVIYSTNNIYNTVSLDIKTQIIDAAANKELFKVGQGIPIAAGQKITIECNFTDEDTGRGIAGVDVITPVAAPHFGSTRTPASDDMHGDLTDNNYQVGANSLTVDLENGAGSTGYLNEFTILGKRLTDYDRITITRKNQTSINQVGNQRYTNRLDLIEDPSRAESIADDILDDYAPSHTAGTRITVLANISDALAQALIEAEVSTKFTAIESITGISKDFYIDKIRYKQEDTLLWVTIDAEEV